ncbi:MULTISPECIES: DUF2750 domain-containing protein [unclassified Exiguobacterium]|uniref:DUF2750 domain-containing protein n=1 Tax=unclassified Exiguobacterium TaxID=2644629 RepID=UPI001BED2F69|nr:MULTISPECIES: DUF2750 domain-containing protein [unclassified Exiguobacterium]
MRLETSLPGVSINQIEEVEATLNIRLPIDLREAWQYDNKFELGEWLFYPIRDERFLNKTWDDLIRANTSNRPPLPAGFVTLANNGSGDELGYYHNQDDSIYIWWHETDEVELVSESIEQLVKGFQATFEIIEHFCDEITENQLVYGLSEERDEGWAFTPSILDETREVLLFFSSRERAEACRVNEWSKYEIVELSFNNFFEVWLPHMIEDEYMCGLDWTPDLVGIEVQPEEMQLYLE